MTLCVVTKEKNRHGTDHVTIFNDTLITVHEPSTVNQLSTNIWGLAPAGGTLTAKGLMQKTLIVDGSLSLTCAGYVPSIVKFSRDFKSTYGTEVARSNLNFSSFRKYLSGVFRRLGVDPGSIQFIVSWFEGNTAKIYQYPNFRTKKIDNVTHYVIGSGSADVMTFLNARATGKIDLYNSDLSTGIPLAMRSATGGSIQLNSDDDVSPFGPRNYELSHALRFAAQALAVETIRGGLAERACNGIFEIAVSENGKFKKLSDFRIVLWITDKTYNKSKVDQFMVLSCSRKNAELYVDTSMVNSYETGEVTIYCRGGFTIHSTDQFPKDARPNSLNILDHSPDMILFAEVNREAGVLTPYTWLMTNLRADNRDFVYAKEGRLSIDDEFLYCYRAPNAKGFRHRITEIVDEKRLNIAQDMSRAFGFFNDETSHLNPPIDPMIRYFLTQIPEPLRSGEKIMIYRANGEPKDFTDKFSYAFTLLQLDGIEERTLLKSLGQELFDFGGRPAMGYFYREFRRQYGVEGKRLESRWNGVGGWRH
jgi:hypothetical protein